MTAKTIEIVLPQMHRTQRIIFDDLARFNIIACGRRWGKSWLAGAFCMIHLARGHLVWWVAPTFDVSKRVGWKNMARALRPLMEAGYATMNKSDLVITLANGAEFQAKSADRPDRLVGEGLDAVVIDEAGIVNQQAWMESIRPALSDKLGQAMLIGTPKGQNWFYQEYLRGFDPLFPDHRSWHFETADNPYILPAEIETARGSLPQRVFDQEYLATFLTDGGAVFRGLKEVAIHPPAPPESRHSYVIGVDWAKSGDFTVLVVIDETTRRMVFMDRFNQISWAVQRGRLVELARRYHARLILAESNSIGEPNIEALYDEGIPVQGFQTTASSKGPLIDALALAIERQEIGLLEDGVLIGELQGYEMRRTPSGMWQYSAPDGGHDDTVIALALALRAMQEGSTVGNVPRARAPMGDRDRDRRGGRLGH